MNPVIFEPTAPSLFLLVFLFVRPQCGAPLAAHQIVFELGLKYELVRQDVPQRKLNLVSVVNVQGSV